MPPPGSQAPLTPLPAVPVRANLVASRLPRTADLRTRQKTMRNWLLITGFLALAIGLLWIGQGTGVIKWPQSSFMISQIQWAGYGAALAAIGLILIWRGKR
jgi:uncharacterized membrane protein